MKVIGYIFARGGSKGVPRKNLRQINHKTLLQYAIDVALGSRYINTVIVSTDDAEIAEHAINAGAKVPFTRPSELATDHANEWLAWQHAANYTITNNIATHGDVFACIPTTTPLKASTHINQCIEKYYLDDHDIIVTGSKSNHHPEFNMVKHNNADQIELINKPKSIVAGRQTVSYEAYNLTTACYITNHAFVLTQKSIFNERVGLVDIGQRAAIDIDTELDLEIAQLLLKSKDPTR